MEMVMIIHNVLTAGLIATIYSNNVWTAVEIKIAGV
jgi:hypothetical protein